MVRVRSHKNLSVGESYKKYFEQVERSEGFDVDSFPALTGYMSRVIPLPLTPFYRTYFTNEAKSAIKHYNKKQTGKAYKLVKVLKATEAVIGSARHRITFVAKQKGEDPKTFQAYLVVFNGNIDYEFVRLKPPALPHQTSKAANTCMASISDKELSMRASYDKYRIQLMESEGFDVDKFPALEGFRGLVHPLPDIPSEQKHVNRCAEKAIEHYNKQNNTTTYEFVKVLKSTIQEVIPGAQHVPGAQHFITFDAKEKYAGDTKTFEASVISFMQTLDFKFVRLKFPPNRQCNPKHPGLPQQTSQVPNKRKRACSRA